MNEDLISRSALKEAIKEWRYHGYYDKLIEVIDNAPTVEEKESSVVTECRKASIEKGLPLYFVYYEETGVFEAYITKTKELFEKRHCSKNLSKYEFEHLAYQYLDDYSDCIEKWIRKQGVENEC